MSPVEIRHITHLPPQILALEKEAIGEGFRFVTRLIAEWHSGATQVIEDVRVCSISSDPPSRPGQ
ncbi:hypothetical protein JOE33_002683 [Pseudomonas sp. PvP027]|jgi:hypothetical protein|nr:hypothetical protein [Pseudomonas sp. PvP027]